MYPESPTPPLSITPTTQSWTRDSTLDDDAQHQTQSDAPGSSTVFEKKWIVTEVGDSGTPFFLICVARLLRSRLSRSGESCVSFLFLRHRTTNDIRHSRSCFLFQDGFQDGALEKNGVFFDPNLDDSSETTGGGGTYRAHCCYTALRTLTTSSSS
jgi:hypothetical protein